MESMVADILRINNKLNRLIGKLSEEQLLPLLEA
jgi:hypothetical protein